MQTALDLEFVPQMAAVRTARDATAAVVPSLSPARQDDMRLLVSVIVTNSVLHRHPRGWIRLTVACGDGTVRVEVRTPGTDISFERSAKAGTLRESGWGMYLLENLADRWGLSSGDGDTCVWFELDQDG